jgi:GNAT superfamily N-acetyltransferase
MTQISTATLLDIPTIIALAKEIWWPTYSEVISAEQISFMLNKMYAEDALKQQMESGHTFLLLIDNDLPKGFASFSKQDESIFKLQKLYLHPDQQGKGTGKMLISFVEQEVKALGATQLILNVNRENKAHLFYKKVGYQIIEELDIPYHHFVLNDYVMGKFLI